MNRTLLITLLALFGVCSTGLAGDFEFAGEDKVPLETTSVSDFEADFRIDGWIVQIDVGLTQTALGLSKSVFIGFDDIISNIDWIVPLGADLRYRQYGFMPDLVALKMSGGGTTPGPFFDQASYNLTLGVLNLPAYIRIVDQPGTTFDVIGGARFLWTDLNVGLTGGPLGPATAGTDLDLWDGIVGLRLEQDLNDKLFCSVYGDVGTGASDLTWQILAGIGYRFTENFSLNTGYRYLHYDLSGENKEAGVTASGIQLTLNWKF